MKFVVEINLDNAAFGDDPQPEVLRLLEQLTGRIKAGGEPCGDLRDYNGNRVGSYGIEE